jgi:hypothetical protein
VFCVFVSTLDSETLLHSACLVSLFRTVCSERNRLRDGHVGGETGVLLQYCSRDVGGDLNLRHPVAVCKYNKLSPFKRLGN